MKETRLERPFQSDCVVTFEKRKSKVIHSAPELILPRLTLFHLYRLILIIPVKSQKHLLSTIPEGKAYYINFV